MALTRRVRDITGVIASWLLLGLPKAVVSEKTCEPRITGLIDGDTPGTDGLPKVVQIYFPCPEDINTHAWVDEFSVATYPGGNSTTGGHEVALRGLAEHNKSFIYISAESKVFEEYMGFKPEYTDPKFYPTGTSVVELLRGKEVIDMYGDLRNSTEHEKWDYTAGTASRIYGTDPNAEAGVFANWVIHAGKVQNRSSEVGTGEIVKFQTCSAFPCLGGQHKDGKAKCKRSTCSEEDCTTCCTVEACAGVVEREEDAKDNRTKDAKEKEEGASENHTSDPGKEKEEGAKENSTSDPGEASAAPKGPGDCSAISCPPGYVIRENPETIQCLAGICNDLDLDTCCSAATTPTPRPAPTQELPTSGSILPGSIQTNEKKQISFLGSVWTKGPLSASPSLFVVAFFLLGVTGALSVAIWKQLAARVARERYSIAAGGDLEQTLSRRSLSRQPLES